MFATPPRRKVADPPAEYGQMTAKERVKWRLKQTIADLDEHWPKD